MTSIIALFTIITSLMNPVGVKVTYYQEDDLIGEIPEVLVMAQHPTESEMRAVGVMPEVSMTAIREVKKQSTENIGLIPEVLVTASQPSIEEMRSVGMVQEVVVTAERYPQTNTDIIRPRPEINHSRPSVKDFYIYAIIVVTGIFLFAWARIFLPVVFRPALIKIERVQKKQLSRRR